MDRTMIGRVVMGLGVVLVIAGLVIAMSDGEDNPVSSAPIITTTFTFTATTTTTAAPVTSVPPITATTTVTTTAPKSETIEEFLLLLNEAFAGSGVDSLLARLDEAVIERYGSDQCFDYLTGILPQSQGLTLRREVGVGPWDYITDNVTTSLADITSLEVGRFVNGETRIIESHWNLVRGEYRWFTDCGAPIRID